jgi:hypothetical protein
MCPVCVRAVWGVMQEGVDAATAKSVVMVGKGIVYDTGGLSMKDPTNMCVKFGVGVVGCGWVGRGLVAVRTCTHVCMCVERCVDCCDADGVPRALSSVIVLTPSLHACMHAQGR